MKKINKYVLKKLYQPNKNSRKGDSGALLLIGGSTKYHGAPWYAIEAASRIVDLIYFHSDKISMRLLSEIKKKSPGFITVLKNELNKIIKKADCILTGPGWGFKSENKKLLNFLLRKHRDKKFVLDADALKMVNKKLLNKNCLLTPHANEFKKMFGLKANPENVQKIAKRYDCYLVLKGQRDVICSPKVCFYNATGNQGMSKGGTGDVLAGLIAAFACKNDLFLAAKAGVYINGMAGDNLYRKYKIYFNARDLNVEIPKIMAKI